MTPQKKKVTSTVWFAFSLKNFGVILLKRSIVGSGAVRRRPMLRGKGQRSVTSGKILLGDFWAEKHLWTSHLFELQLLVIFVPQVFGEWLKSVCVCHSKNSSLFRIYACWFRIWICAFIFFLSLVSSQISSKVEKKCQKKVINLPCFSLPIGTPPNFNSSPPKKMVAGRQLYFCKRNVCKSLC